MAAVSIAGAATSSPASVPGVRAASPLLVARHRLQLPDGSLLMLRREYRAIFRNLPMHWSDGLLLERGHYAANVRTSRVRLEHLPSRPSQIRALRKRRALPITETEERLIAAAASIGESSSPVTG